MAKSRETLRLWKELKKLGNFTDVYYDKCIIDDLKKALSIKGDFEDGICKMSSEDFLLGFFNVISPLTFMYTDILLLFERCGANAGRKNIEIKIGSDGFGFTNFNASHFIHAKEVMDSIKQSTKRVNLTIEGIFKLFDVNKDFFRHWDWDKTVAPIIWNKSFTEWYNVYFAGDAVCPEVCLDFSDIIKSSPIKNGLEDAYIFWSALFDFYKPFNTTRYDWLEIIHKQEEVKRNFFYPETDYVLGSSLGALYYLAENYEFLPQEKKEEVKISLHEFNDYVSHEIIEKSMKIWENFLKLPVWEKRYELYSVWVFSQIIESVPNNNLKFNITENTLHFTFSRELIASAEFNGEKVDFWNELKTKKIEDLLGHGRKHAIQPDFSVVCGSPDDVGSSIAVVECKQYKTPNYTNFSRAIIDYSNNRPNSKIVLADYGDFNVATLASKIKIPEERYKLLPLCRPGHESEQILSEYILNLVRQHVGMTFLDDKANFSLKWNEKPADLDLHLIFKTTHLQEPCRLNYSSNDVPDAEYSGDITHGFGPESITINKWNDGIYELWCHNYSGIPTLSKSDAILTVNFDGVLETFTLECPKDGDSQWWHILTIDTYNCELKIINELICVN